MSKKICFFSPSSYTYFYPNSGITSGGAELQMMLWAKNIATNNDYEVSFLVGNYGQAKSDKIENVNLIRCFRLPKSESKISKLIKAVKYFFLLARIKPDVVITSTAASTVGLTSFYKKFLGYKHIFRAAHIFDADLSWVKGNGVLGKIYNYGLRNADKIITQNKEQYEAIKINYSIESVIIKNISNHSKKDVYTKSKGVLWVGRLNEFKQPELFLELAALIPDTIFTMICNYNELFVKKWEELSNNAKNTNNIIFLESVDYSKINKYFSDVEVFVSTSKSEGFPNTFLQAAAGKTPIVSLAANPDNFLNNYKCGICCDNDFNKMIHSVKTLLSDKEKAKMMGENAYKYLEENHNANKIAKQLSEVIETISN